MALSLVTMHGEEGACPQGGPRLVLAGAESAPPVDAGSPISVLQQFDAVQREMDCLREELSLLRRRDDQLNFYLQRIDEELRLAAKLQRDFLPKSMPQLGTVRFHSLFRPAGYVSGDMYDVMRLDESHVGFYIADAVGHGMPAALLTMFVKHALTTKEISNGRYRLLRPSESIARLNEALLEQNLAQSMFATALYGMIDVRTFELTLACAGHPAPMLLSEGQGFRPLPVEGGLLGVFPGEVYTDYITRLSPGDRLFLYTDGIELAFSKEPKEADFDRWQCELLQRRSLPIAQILAEFSDTADQASGSIEPKDDVTIVVLEVQK